MLLKTMYWKKKYKRPKALLEACIIPSQECKVSSKNFYKLRIDQSSKELILLRTNFTVVVYLKDSLVKNKI